MAVFSTVFYVLIQLLLLNVVFKWLFKANYINYSKIFVLWIRKKYPSYFDLLSYSGSHCLVQYFNSNVVTWFWHSLPKYNINSWIEQLANMKISCSLLVTLTNYSVCYLNMHFVFAHRPAIVIHTVIPLSLAARK